MAVLGNTKITNITLLDGVIGDLNPVNTDAYNLGTSSLRWNNLYAKAIYGTTQAQTDNSTAMATTAYVHAAINALDVSAIAGATNKTLTSISEANGKISATYSNIAINENQVTWTGATLYPIGDDIYIGDVNQSGHLGLKSHQAGNTGLAFIKSATAGDTSITAPSGTTIGKLTWDGAKFILTGTAPTLGSSTIGSSSLPVYVNAGVITAITAKDTCNALINALDTGSSVLTANDYVITQYVGGGTTTTTYHRRPASAIRVGGLLTARKLKVALGSTIDVTFNGTADQTSIPVSGILDIAHGGTGAATAADAWTALGGGASGKHADSYFALASHNHAASNITSGTFDAARIPNLSWNKITSDKPTTLSGYGITDAKIVSGVITLGSNTITPVTSVNGHTGSSVTVTAADLGLSKAMRFIGVATVAITDGSTTDPVISGYSTKTAGDVIIDKDNSREYVWSTTNKWELLGGDSSYKTTQSAVDSGAAATNKWVSRIQQNANGVVTATMGTLDTSGTWSGNAATATKLAAARNIQTNLASTAAASFDGHANVTPGVTGVLPIANGGTGVTTEALIRATYGIEYIAGTQTANTNAWTGVTSSAALYTGKTIAYYLPYAGTSTAATLNLTLSGGSTTGAKDVRINNSKVTTHFPAGTVILLVYDGTYWKVDNYDSNSNTLLRVYSSATNLDVPLIGQSSANNVTAAWTSYTGTYKDWYGAIPNDDTLRAKINLSTGHITVPGGITANITGNVTGSSGSCTGNAASATWVGKGSHTEAITTNEFSPAVGTMTVLGNVSNTTMSHTNNANAEIIIKAHPSSSTNYYEARLGFSSNGKLYYMPVNLSSWKQIAYTDSDISGNAATATALTSNAGSATQPIYFSGGKPVATTYALSATVNSGMTNHLAYYSSVHGISQYTNNVGTEYTPIYIDNGIPKAASVVQYNTWEIASGTTGVTLGHIAYNTNTYVISLVVTSGEQYLNGAINWTSTDGGLMLSTVKTSGKVSGYILTAIGTAI